MLPPRCLASGYLELGRMKFSRTIGSRQVRTAVADRGNCRPPGWRWRWHRLPGHRGRWAVGGGRTSSPASPSAPARALLRDSASVPAGSAPAGRPVPAPAFVGSAGSPSAEFGAGQSRPRSPPGLESAATSPAPAGNRAHRAAPNSRCDLGTIGRPGGRRPGYLTAPANLIDGHYYEVLRRLRICRLRADHRRGVGAGGRRQRPGRAGQADRLYQPGRQGRQRPVGGRLDRHRNPLRGGGSLAKEALLAEVTGYDPTTSAATT